MSNKSTSTGFEIAVIGMSGRFPGAKDLDAYWENLASGKETIKFFSDEELLEAGIEKQTLADKNYIKAGGYLDNKDDFDASFFNYNPGEANIMDPQIRVFHEVVHSALEDAGYSPDIYKGLIGLFAGASQNHVWIANTMLNDKLTTVDEFTKSKLNNKDFLTTLISYKLNLKGPSVALQTACSTSLVAIHMACRSLLLGECKMALAGGVSISTKQKSGYLYKENMILSPDGHCRAFDAKSGGTVIGEGAGVVVLKKLKDAVADGDNIYAVVKGSAINNDGVTKVGFTAPSIGGQSDCIKLAHKIARVAPETISYVEAHGTGTSLGDPIEIEALNKAFNNEKNKHCSIGSVKTNIGHLDVAAGVAGFIKTVLALKNKQIPPTLHFESANQNIDFENGPFKVNEKLLDWKKDKVPLRAGVSSFGIGGTNAHIVLEEAPETEVNNKITKPQLVVISAKTDESLNRQQENLKNFLLKGENVNFADLAWTLQSGRKEYSKRITFVAQNSDEAISILDNIEAAKINIGVSQKVKKKVAFMFSGQGAQYVNMGKELYDSEEVFRSVMDNCFNIVKDISGRDLKKIVFTDLDNEKLLINETINTQPILFIFEYSLAKQLEHIGIIPDIMIGHSIGEYTAACLSEVITLEDALKLVIKRGELMQGLPEGSMLAVGLSAKEIEPYLTNDVNIAAINTQSSCVLSGSNEGIETLLTELKAKEIPFQKVHTSHAFHSEMMTPILNDYEKVVSSVKIREPKIPYISNLTGKEVKYADITNKKYWSDHIRHTVNFSVGLETILSTENVILIEVGPGKTLSNFVRQHQTIEKPIKVVNLVRHPKEKISDVFYFLENIGKLWSLSVQVNWENVHDDGPRKKMSLPTYPFEKTKYTLGEDVYKIFAKGLPLSSFEEQRTDISKWLYEPCWKQSRLIAKNQEKATDNCYLIFMDNESVGENIAATLRSRSDKVVLVKRGDSFQQLEDNQYLLNPMIQENYRELFNDLETKGIRPTNIVHLFCVNSLEVDTNSDKSQKSYKDLGFNSLLQIAKCLNNYSEQIPVTLSVISNDLQAVLGNETIQPLKSLVLGISMVISQENPFIQCQCIDIVLNEESSARNKYLLNEINTPVEEKFIAYRNNKRWVKIYETISLEENVPCENTKLRRGGVYLISGGLGSLGFVFAKYLLEVYDAKLILTGSIEIKEDGMYVSEAQKKKTTDRISRLKILQEKGEVIYLKANIADFKEMLGVVEMGETSFGEINGVIHAAGITKGDSIRAINFLKEEPCESQFDPKVYGVQVLKKIVGEKELDFCLLVSSLSAILGGKEYAAYASANVFLDYYSQKGVIKNSVSINFDGLDFSESQDGALLINESEIVNIFQKVLSIENIPQVVVSVADLNQRLNKWLHQSKEELQSLQSSSELVNNLKLDRVNLITKYVEPTTETEVQLVKLFEVFFGVKEIGINDDLFELGADSLKAMTLINQLHREFDVEVSLEDFFLHRTINKLATVIENRIWLSKAEETNNNIII